MWGTHFKSSGSRFGKGVSGCNSLLWVLAEAVQFIFSLHKAMGILKKHVNITLKMWSDTRWESKVKSVEPLRYQASEMRDALLR